MNDPAASTGVSSFLLSRHSVLDTESSRVFWIPAFAGMTTSRQAVGNAPEGIQECLRGTGRLGRLWWPWNARKGPDPVRRVTAHSHSMVLGGFEEMS